MLSNGCVASYRARARYRMLPLAAFCVACVASVLAAAPKPAAFDAEKALSSRKADERLRALEAVRRGGARVPQAKLRAGHKAEKDPLVRLRYLQALSAAGDAGTLGDLLSALDADPSPSVRQAAAQELGRQASAPGVVSALARALGRDGAAEVRYACALSLALSDTPEAASALERAAADPDPALRRQAAFSLKRHKSAKARQALKRLEKDEDRAVREMARP